MDKSIYLTEEQLENNKKEYLDLIDSIELEGADIESFKSWLLERSDFFTAPASTKYHASYGGGLCQHSLNVYHILVNLVETYASHKELNPAWNPELGEEQEEPQYITVPDYSADTLKIVALLHDISKANFYEKYLRNVKNDITGKWEQVEEYRTRDVDNRFIFGNHEQNSEFIVRTFFPLTPEESSAILHHHAGMGFDSTQTDISIIYNKYSLACLLHTADILATFIIEKK